MKSLFLAISVATALASSAAGATEARVIEFVGMNTATNKISSKLVASCVNDAALQVLERTYADFSARVIANKDVATEFDLEKDEVGNLTVYMQAINRVRQRTGTKSSVVIQADNGCAISVSQ
jgi:hypothetical protein